MSKRSRTEISIEKKYEIIMFKEKNPNAKNTEIERKFDVKQQTLTAILKNAEKIKNKYGSSCINNQIKRLKTTKFDKTSTALLQWFTASRATNPELPISGEMLRQKATHFARELNELDAQGEVDMNWISRWKKQCDISSKKMSGESAAVTDDMISQWHQVRQQILTKYSAEDIYNADECGLFYQMTPDQTMAFKDEKVHGAKKGKKRITILNCASMTGEKLPLLVISRFQNPRCFKNIKIPVTYKANRRSWMTSEHFKEWLVKLDNKMRLQKRFIALILDNCPAHPSVSGLTNVQLYFLPPNTTSRTQPLDAGVINSMKCKYRKRLVEALLFSLENKVEFKYTLLDAIINIKNAWDDVSKDTIINCFRHVGFVSTTGDAENQNNGASDASEQPPQTSIDLQFRNVFDRLREFIDIPENVSCDSYSSFDDDIPISPSLSDNDIIYSVRSTADAAAEPDDDDVDDSDEQAIPSAKEAADYGKKLILFLASREEFAQHVNTLNKINSDILSESCKSKKQTKIADYFK